MSGVRAVYASFPSELRIAPDPHARALAPLPLAAAARALTAVPLFAQAVHHGLGVASLGLSWHVALRTLAIDDAAREAFAAGARQLVLLGAGLDNRAGRLAQGIRSFEVDHPDMQRYKRARLQMAGVRDDRVLVPVDFERDTLSDSLVRAGFSADVPALWIWESVTPYLTREAITSTLRQVASLSAPGSRLVVTYIRPPHVLGPRLHRLSSLLASTVGEHLRGRFEREEMESLLRETGFEVVSDESDHDLALRYWKDPRGALPRTMHLVPEWERLAVTTRAEA